MRSARRGISVVLLRSALLFFLAGPTSAVAENLALVVGVSAYGESRQEREAEGFRVPESLPNAVNDAQLVRAALVSAGFIVPPVVEDPSRGELIAAVNQFAERLRQAGPEAVGFFYFAGHGLQGVPLNERDVDNFLIPINTSVKYEHDLESEAYGLSRVSATLSRSGAKAIILVLDACRNFGLEREATRGGTQTRGLAEASADGETIIAYSAAPGELSSDGPKGGNGPYAAALAAQIRNARGARLDNIFYATRDQVTATTKINQKPWLHVGMGLAGLKALPLIGIAPQSATVVQADQLVFEALNQPCEYAAFVRDYATSPLTALARTRAGSALPCEEAVDIGTPIRTGEQPQSERRCKGRFCAPATGVEGASDNTVAQRKPLEEPLDHSIPVWVIPELTGDLETKAERYEKTIRAHLAEHWARLVIDHVKESWYGQYGQCVGSTYCQTNSTVDACLDDQSRLLPPNGRLPWSGICQDNYYVDDEGTVHGAIEFHSYLYPGTKWYGRGAVNSSICSESTYIRKSKRNKRRSAQKCADAILDLRQLVQARQEVRVTLLSDQQTKVSIYAADDPAPNFLPPLPFFSGTFDRRDMELLPGKYFVWGRREGYREVRRELNVAPGAVGVKAAIRCEEKI